MADASPCRGEQLELVSHSACLFLQVALSKDTSVSQCLKHIIFQAVYTPQVHIVMKRAVGPEPIAHTLNNS